jgi:AcrR family transcriptional regulator
MTDRRPGARERVRAEMILDIKRAARARLATDGANLSLRAVARDLGVVSSATYRYFASRDDLLTALIIDAYDDLGEAVERAEAQLPRRDLAGRWAAAGRAVRAWSVANPHEYALLYGSPVPGYAAPQDTVAPASRPVLVLVAVLRDGVERAAIEAPADRLPRAVRAELAALGELDGFGGVPPALMARAMGAWAQLFGLISFELFGRFTGAVTDFDAFFEHQLHLMAASLGVHR